MGQLLDGDGTKIYTIDNSSLKEAFSYLASDNLPECYNAFNKYFTSSEEINPITDLNDFLEAFDPNGHQVGFSVKEDKIVLRAYANRGGKIFPLLFSAHYDAIKPEYKKELDNKNIFYVFDEECFFKIDELGDYFEMETDAEAIRKVIFLEDNLNKESDLRGEASIMDTGLFGFKNK